MSDIETVNESIVQVPFRGGLIAAVRRADEVWVPVKPICESLCIDYKTQHEKLSSAEWAGMGLIPIPDKRGRKQDTFCISLDTLPMWLVTIDANRVNADSKDLLIAYQKEAKKALHEYFFAAQQTVSIQISGLDPRLQITLLQLNVVREKPAAWEELFPLKFRKRIMELDGKIWMDHVPSPAGILPMVYREIYEELFGEAAYDAIKGLSVKNARYHQILTDPMREAISKELDAIMRLSYNADNVAHLLTMWRTSRDPAKHPHQMSLMARIGGAMKLLVGGKP